MTTRSEITELLLRFENLANSPIRGAMPEKVAAVIETFYDTLQDLPIEMVQAAGSAYLASGKFFPAPADFRHKAVEIALLTMGVPTPAEAWGMLLNGSSIIETVRCDTGITLFHAVEGKAGAEYWAALGTYSRHTDECDGCYQENRRNTHPAVQKAFDEMGGDRAVFTDNRSADRARFQEGYQQFVEREVLRLTMPADVRGYIKERQSSLPTEQVKQLAERLSV